ncbi:MAG: biopolymer transporter ExbD [Aquificae bacterium]|nr:biopolymer transporter ExbD [Aquificota bacterium]
MNLRRRVRFKEEERTYIDVVPLVDTLLAVFLFLAVLAFRSPETFIGVKLPKAESGETARLTALKVTLTAEGKLLFKGKPVKEEELYELLRRERPEYLVLEADERVYHGRVVEVMDLAKRAGVEHLVIAVRKKR